jgi:Kae1-associated kinase Bud32
MGAEAHIMLAGNVVSKKRIKKSYRIKQIDVPLRKRRTRLESRLMSKAADIINCPKILGTRKFTIKMEYVEGPQLKEALEAMSEKERTKICHDLGKQIASLHEHDIIHGDLTTSNMILNRGVYFIDFGLGFVSKKVEDKAVDLLLLKRALFSKHPDIAEKSFRMITSAYGDKEVLERLNLVESRGRYKKRT